jgi:phosphotransferase system enzyme I (PtsI)
MSATSILKARSQILRLSKKEMEDLAENALQMSTTSQVIELVKAATEKEINLLTV